MSVDLNIWEEGDWPIEAEDEICADHYEDLRKRIFLLEHWQSAGYTSYSDWIIRTHANWGDAPFLCTDSPSHPGEIRVWFTHPKTGEVRLYANYYHGYKAPIDPAWVEEYAGFPGEYSTFDVYAGGDGAWSNCPINTDGTENSKWREIPTYNRYHHWDYNSGKWILSHRSGNVAYPYSSHDVKLPAHHWLPRQTDPYEQILPIKNNGGCTRRFSPVEFMKRQVTKGSLSGENIQGTIGGMWNRAAEADAPADPNSYLGVWPTKQSPYIVDYSHPFDERLAGLGITMYQHSFKRSTAYQEEVLAAAETARYFVRIVDSAWIVQWTKRKEETAVEWTDGGVEYDPGDIVKNDGVGTWVYYTCIVQNTNKEPGVHADWQDYWLVGVYHPDRTPSHPAWEHFNNRYWNCNSSIFELCLRTAGEYDWFWDDQTPTMDIGIYNGRLWAFRNAQSPATHPIAVGCWRRTWKHSMGRVTLFDGTPAKMWPQELGNPNDYFGITEGQYLIGSQSDYDTIYSPYQHIFEIVDVAAMMAKYEIKMAANNGYYEEKISERHDPVQTEHIQDDEGEFIGPTYPWRYGLVVWPRGYRVRHGGVHYELLNDLVYADKEPRDDPDNWRPRRIPEYELVADILNHMREVLIQFKYVDASEWITAYNHLRWREGYHGFDPVPFPSRADAIDAGIARAEWDPPDLVQYTWSKDGDENPDWVDCGYVIGSSRSLPNFYPLGSGTAHPWYVASDTELPSIGELTLVILHSEDFPKICLESDMVMRVCYRARSEGMRDFATNYEDCCLLGFGDITFKPDRNDITEMFAYTELGPIEVIEEAMQWVDKIYIEGHLVYHVVDGIPKTWRNHGYVGAGSDPPGINPAWDEVNLYYTKILDVWPSEDAVSKAFLERDGTAGQIWWSRETLVKIPLDAHLPYIIEIDWDKYSDAEQGDVFELDCENAIEVEE